VKQTKDQNMNRFLIIGTILLVLSSILSSPRAASAESAGGIGVDAALSCGVRFVDIEGETYDLKPVGIVGACVIPRIPLSKDTVLAMEVSVSYGFRSDYSGLYYYESYYSVGIMPQLGFLLPGRGTAYALYLGAGLYHSFSDYNRSIYPALTARVGIEPYAWVIDGIYLSYEKGFPEGYSAFDTLRLFIVARLFRRPHEGGDR